MKLVVAFLRWARGKRPHIRMTGEFEYGPEHIAFSSDRITTLFRRWAYYRALGYR